MKDHIGHTPFTVEPFSEDFTGRLSWRFLGNHLLRCASLHAGHYGFGYEDMQQANHAWVLSRLVVEMDDMPRTGEHYNIETWVNNIYRQFTDRLFRVTGDGGKVYGHGFSIWALIDVESRQPADLTQLPNGGFINALNEQSVPIKGPGKVRVRSAEPARTLTACYSDLDINGHVNSIRYIEMLLDTFDSQLFASRPVRRIEMAYSAETLPGETLHIFHDPEDENGRCCMEIRKATGETVVKAAVELA